MAREPSLLAHLIPKLTSRGEDTATEALAFILNKSETCRSALNSLLDDEDFGLGPLTRFDTQVTHEDGSRPDMVGYDGEGEKRLIVEAKFWAALGEGQASGYFSQLEVSGAAALMFVAPGTRVETLWTEITRQMDAGENPVQLGPVETLDRTRRARVGSDRLLMLVSWDLLLERLAAAVSADSPVASDIQQLRGFVEEQDLDAFRRWALTDLALNINRGRFAEWLVGRRADTPLWLWIEFSGRWEHDGLYVPTPTRSGGRATTLTTGVTRLRSSRPLAASLGRR